MPSHQNGGNSGNRIHCGAATQRQQQGRLLESHARRRLRIVPDTCCRKCCRKRGSWPRHGPSWLVRAIPLQRFVPNGEIIVPVEAALDLAPQARKQRPSYKQIRIPRRDI